MFAWKSTDSYIPLGVVIFSRVILHLKEKAALNKCAFPALMRCPGLETSGSWLPLAGDSAAAVAVPTAHPNAAASNATSGLWLESRGGPDVFGNWVTQNLQLEGTAGP